MNEVLLIKNDLLNSNAFIVPVSIDSVLIIDPGSINISFYTKWLTENQMTINAVILTHEHSDHCIGVNPLFELMSFNLICSENASKGISNCKLNFSAYIENIEPFEIKIPVQVVTDCETMQIGNKTIQFYLTPGHSPGSICFRINKSFFTGDTLLNNAKTPLNIPKSNKEDYLISVARLKRLIQPNTNIYPGHGYPFVYQKDTL